MNPGRSQAGPQKRVRMYVIDGHNLIPKIPGWSLENIDDEQQLIEALVAFCRSQGRSAEVFFDRAPVEYAGERRYGRVIAHFVRQGYSADNAIRDRLAQLGKSARGVTVVSSDRQVQAEARSRGAAVVSSDAFARTLLSASRAAPAGRPPAKAEDGLNADEVQQWLDMFGGEPQDNSLPESQAKRRKKGKKPGR